MPPIAQEPSWEDLRILRAVIQHGSLSLAAAALGVTQPTVGRRIAALEEQLGALLIERSPAGCTPTQVARLMIPHLDQMVAAAEGITHTRQLAHAELAGTVRIATGELVARLITRKLSSLLAQSPQLQIEILAQTGFVNLARGDADIALRSQIPAGENWVTRALGAKSFGIWASTRYIEQNPAALDPAQRLARCRWLTFSADQQEMPSARWIAQHVHPDAPRLRFDRSSLIIEACIADLGLAVLPCHVASIEERLVRVAERAEGATLAGYIVTSTSAHRIPRVRHVFRWLVELLSAAPEDSQDADKNGP